MHTKEYLKISNFGPIREIEINDIAPLTIFIGESGSGKSTVMKVLSMMRWIYKRVVLRSYVRQAQIKVTGIGIQLKTILKTSGLEDFMHADTEIVFGKGNYEIVIARNNLNCRTNVPADNLSLEKICFISDKRSVIPDFLDSKLDRKVANYYLQDTYDNFLIANQAVKQLRLDCLNVKYYTRKRSNGIEEYRIQGVGEDDYDIQLKNASSGTQTVTPLSLIVEYYARHFDAQKSMNSSLLSYLMDNDKLKDFNTAKNIGDIQSKNVHLFIEEPELSLYPESQCRLMDFLISNCFLASHEYRMTLMLATHSPYIVNYMNLLLRRGQYDSESALLKLQPNQIDVFQILESQAVSLKCRTGSDTIIDTRTLSDPIADIYEQYNAIGNENNSISK